MNTHNKKTVINKFIILLLSFCILVFSLVPFSLSWFSSPSDDYAFDGHALIGYFARGNGTSASPYVINQAKHFYNFAWLQYLGLLPDDTYVVLDPALAAPNGKGLDMAGMLAGTKGRSGAIPPIGTTSNPFTGNFDGNGVVIKNLWVSTDPADWYERPASYSSASVGTDVGVFGRIDSTKDVLSDIKNFYLENVEITSTVGTNENKANLGIIAGYANANINNIGVKNAKVSFKSGASSTVNSDYSLIGALSEYTLWEDDVLSDFLGSHNAGGDLVINPTENNEAGSVNEENTPLKIDRSIEGTAFYTYSLSVASAGNKSLSNQNTYKYDGTISFDNQALAGYTTMAKAPLAFTNSDVRNSVDTEFIDLLGNQASAIFPEDVPDFSGVTATKNDDGTYTYTYPTNSVWFKPVDDGNCAIAFSRKNNAGDEVMSIYRYERYTQESANIPTGKKVGDINMDSLQEIVLVLSKGPTGNPSYIYFELDLKKGYEYVIGKTRETSINTLKNNKKINKIGGSAGFIFLKLAGTDITNGDVTADDGIPYRILKDIDFVENTGIKLTEVDTHKSILTLSGTQAGTGAIYFNAQIINSVDYVIYHNASSITMKQVVTSTPQAMEIGNVTATEFDAYFPPRKETPPGAETTTTTTGT